VRCTRELPEASPADVASRDVERWTPISPGRPRPQRLRSPFVLVVAAMVVAAGLAGVALVPTRAHNEATLSQQPGPVSTLGAGDTAVNGSRVPGSADAATPLDSALTLLGLSTPPVGYLLSSSQFVEDGGVSGIAADHNGRVGNPLRRGRAARHSADGGRVSAALPRRWRAVTHVVGRSAAPGSISVLVVVPSSPTRSSTSTVVRSGRHAANGTLARRGRGAIRRAPRSAFAELGGEFADARRSAREVVSERNSSIGGLARGMGQVVVGVVAIGSCPRGEPLVDGGLHSG
jgi:hypothetical protein